MENQAAGGMPNEQAGGAAPNGVTTPQTGGAGAPMQTTSYAPQSEPSDEATLPIGPIIVDGLIIAVVGVLLVFIPRAIGLPPKLGFFCDDYSIRYTFHKTTVSIIAASILMIVSIVVPVMVVEIFRIMKRNGVDFDQFTILPSDFIVLIKRMGLYYGSCAVGVLLNVALSRMAKFTVGRLKPHFLEVCKPSGRDWDYCAADPHRNFYVSHYECTGDSKSEFEARTSFYRSRVSLTAHVACYTAMYMQERLPARMYSYMLRPLLQSALVSSAIFVGFAAVRDRDQFISDVLFALGVGFLTALYSAVFVARMFRRKKFVSKGPGGRATKQQPASEPAAQPPRAPPAAAAPGAETAPKKLDPYVVAPHAVDQSVISEPDSVLKSSVNPAPVMEIQQ